MPTPDASKPTVTLSPEALKPAVTLSPATPTPAATASQTATPQAPEPLPLKKKKDDPDSVEEHQTDYLSKMLINKHKELTGKTISESAAESMSKTKEKLVEKSPIAAAVLPIAAALLKDPKKGMEMIGAAFSKSMSKGPNTETTPAKKIEAKVDEGIEMVPMGKPKSVANEDVKKDDKKDSNSMTL